tara:strand:- start:15636 stop:16514 length:879 start_codon:yes stop_codon:yes gene_type:complete
MAISPEGISKRFEATLRRSVSRLEQYMATLVAQLDSDDEFLVPNRENLARATLMRQQLTDELNRLGFQTDVRNLYADVAKTLALEAGDDPEQMLIAETVLSGFASNFTRHLDNSWFTMTGQIQDIVEQAILTNAPVLDLLYVLAGPERASIRISAPLEASFSQWLNWSAAAVDTALSGLLRRISVVQATEAGVEFYVYGGTLIKTSRPFCRLMEGVVVRLEDLRAIETDPRFRSLRRLREKDGRQPPIVTTLGGWRCRHSLRAISLAEAKRQNRTIFRDASEELIQKAEEML